MPRIERQARPLLATMQVADTLEIPTTRPVAMLDMGVVRVGGMR
jgi:hypothetical protein